MIMRIKDDEYFRNDSKRKTYEVVYRMCEADNGIQLTTVPCDVSFKPDMYIKQNKEKGEKRVRVCALIHLTQFNFFGYIAEDGSWGTFNNVMAYMSSEGVNGFEFKEREAVYKPDEYWD